MEHQASTALSPPAEDASVTAPPRFRAPAVRPCQAPALRLPAVAGCCQSVPRSVNALTCRVGNPSDGPGRGGGERRAADGRTHPSLLGVTCDAATYEAGRLGPVTGRAS